MEYLIRFLIGGLVVSAFSVAGEILRPRSYSGIFGAAPTIALATLGLAYAKIGASNVSIEGRSMMIGAAAMFSFSLMVRYLQIKRHWSSLYAALASLMAWLAVAFGLWLVIFG